MTIYPRHFYWPMTSGSLTGQSRHRVSYIIIRLKADQIQRTQTIRFKRHLTTNFAQMATENTDKDFVIDIPLYQKYKTQFKLHHLSMQVDDQTLTF